MTTETKTDNRIVGSAALSDCRTYRYELRRTWDFDLPQLGVCGLNPSTADESIDDQTVRKWIGFSRALGFGGFVAVNEFGFRTSKPKILQEAIRELGVATVVGPGNDEFILKVAREVGTFVVCWGAHGWLGGRNDAICDLLDAAGIRAKCWGLTNDGAPRHALMIPYSTPLVNWP